MMVHYTITGSNTVHPRGRGEHTSGRRQRRSSAGSSPRARGTPAPRLARTANARFIPAGAGNTTHHSPLGNTGTVHPRGRGEHRMHKRNNSGSNGSSPRARGTQHSETYGILRAVHPRGRGEHLRSIPAADHGSSPRARGTLRERLDELKAERFIPAGAGNTLGPWCLGCSISVHPRGRGEHVRADQQVDGVIGSSPRARGTRGRLDHTPKLRRFIPAGAGNTTTYASTDIPSTVHPRGRGEHIRPTEISAQVVGSSPRARGTQKAATDNDRPNRFIPAGAGNTAALAHVRQSRTVHPRGRGEHWRMC